MTNTTNLIYYYVDESGDFTLFDKNGLPVQKTGASTIFMLGLLKAREVHKLNTSFANFRQQILADPIFQSFPSIKKTKLHFHAKDDHIAIRREVFNYIAELDFSIQAIVRRKNALIEQAKTQFEYTENKMTDKQIYRDLIGKLFHSNIHKVDHYNIYFSNRGKTFTNNSLKDALHFTREKFCFAHNINSNSNFQVFCSNPSEHPGLQIVDYCLWALYRMYEQNEDVYFNIIRDKFKVILDVDDKRKKGYGMYYTNKNQISLAEINKSRVS